MTFYQGAKVGCDIHLAAEVFVNGGWTHILRAEAVGQYEGDTPSLEWYEGRNYTLFGCLAGVRDRHNGQIAPQRGLPVDADPRSLDMSQEEREKLEALYPSPAYDALRDGRCDGDHSASWLLLSEVLDWPRWKEPVDEPERLISLLAGNLEYDPDLREGCSHFLQAMEDLRELAFEKHGATPDQVRILFNFDS